MNEVLKEMQAGCQRGQVVKLDTILYQKLVELHFLYDLITPTTEEMIFHSYQVLERKESLDKIILTPPLTSLEFDILFDILMINNHQECNFHHPFCSFSGHIKEIPVRITMLHQSLSAANQKKIFIRVHRTNSISLDSFGAEELLANFISSKKNVLIAGATGSGKTTLLTSIAKLIPKNEHLVILEDAHEIFLEGENVTSFLSNAKNELNDFFAYSMRVSPDRIILGEVRTKEVIPFIMAMNHGHRGLLSTIHADTAIDAIYRTALLFCLFSNQKNIDYATVLKLVASNIDYVVYVQNKKITEIIQILGSERDQCYFEKLNLTS
ncbi:MAG: Flp pilus assembly complex ATPase component TadA [Bacteriovoracaceae bacterium]|nr:Flp pilus assembly complex ATPase component TadA [Bacteriovoracaceae bacterium]